MPRNRVAKLTPRLAELAGLPAPSADYVTGPKRTRKPVPLVADSVTVSTDPARVELTVGVRLGSRANLDSHAHWRVRQRAKQELDGTLGVLLRAKVPEGVRRRLAGGCVIRLARIAPRRLESDNLVAAMKQVRDLIAQWLLAGRSGQRDGDPRLDWRPPDQWGADGAYGLSVKMWEAHQG